MRMLPFCVLCFCAILSYFKLNNLNMLLQYLANMCLLVGIMSVKTCYFRTYRQVIIICSENYYRRYGVVSFSIIVHVRCICICGSVRTLNCCFVDIGKCFTIMFYVLKSVLLYRYGKETLIFIIIDAVRLRFPQITEYEITKRVSAYLAASRDRDGGRKTR